MCEMSLLRGKPCREDAGPDDTALPGPPPAPCALRDCPDRCLGIPRIDAPSSCRHCSDLDATHHLTPRPGRLGALRERPTSLPPRPWPRVAQLGRGRRRGLALALAGPPVPRPRRRRACPRHARPGLGVTVTLFESLPFEERRALLASARQLGIDLVRAARVAGTPPPTLLSRAGQRALEGLCQSFNVRPPREGSPAREALWEAFFAGVVSVTTQELAAFDAGEEEEPVSPVRPRRPSH